VSLKIKYFDLEHCRKLCTERMFLLFCHSTSIIASIVICLYACISQKSHFQHLLNFMYVLSVVVSWSSS